MAPAKKAKDETASAEVMVSLDTYRQTRDSVILSLSNVQKGLAHVQNGLNELMTAYIKHTASVLAGEDGALESLQLPSDIAETANSAMAAATFAINNVTHAVAPASTATATAANATEAGKPTKKRKREKKEKDPNAPKRPLTAAFLYIQAARPVVKKDLEAELAPGQKLEPNAVNIEVNKRWNEMSEGDKEQWKASYRESLKKYQEDVQEYNASKDAAAEELLHLEEEGSDEAEVGALDSDAESDSEDEAAVTSPVAKAPTPPAATAKTPRTNKRQKTAAAPQVNGSAQVTMAPASGPTPVPVPVRQVTQVMPPASSIEVVAPTPAKKDKKKSKAAPQPIAPAPTPAEEASPDETRKRSKSSRTTRNAEVEAPSEEKENKPAKKRERSKKKTEAGAA